MANGGFEEGKCVNCGKGLRGGKCSSCNKPTRAKSEALKKKKASTYASESNFKKYQESGDSKFLSKKKPKGEHYALGEGWEEKRK